MFGSPRRSLLAAAPLVLVLALAACGAPGSSAPGGAGGTAATATSKGCAPTPGDALVVLADDKKLQTVDNVVPAVNAQAATPPLLAALDKVSAALTTSQLIAMNKSVDLDRKTSPDVARQYVDQQGLATGLSGGSGKVVVGAANFGENQTLANIYALVLRAAGFDATVQTIGNRELYEPALESGQIQVVPEYAGTLTEFLNKKVNGPGAAPQASGDLTATMSALTGLAQRVGLVVGKPAQAADQNAFAVTKAFADRYQLRTLSDLAAKCNGGPLVLGGPPECAQRPFCQPGLQQTYGLAFTGFQALDAGGPLTKTAVKQGRVQLGLVFSSDGSLAG
ncbi:MAG: glycine betaine ABC transporter substrate-binding protein [Actinomycetota bacterium]